MTDSLLLVSVAPRQGAIPVTICQTILRCKLNVPTFPPRTAFLPRMGAQHVCWERLVCVPITILRDNHRCPQCSPLHTSGTVLSSHQTNTSSSSSRKFSNYLLSVGAAGACGGEEERSLTETITASLPVATDHPQPTTHPQTPRTPANTE